MQSEKQAKGDQERTTKFLDLARQHIRETEDPYQQARRVDKKQLFSYIIVLKMASQAKADEMTKRMVRIYYLIYLDEFGRKQSEYEQIQKAVNQNSLKEKKSKEQNATPSIQQKNNVQKVQKSSVSWFKKIPGFFQELIGSKKEEGKNSKRKTEKLKSSDLKAVEPEEQILLSELQQECFPLNKQRSVDLGSLSCDNLSSWPTKPKHQ